MLRYDDYRCPRHGFFEVMQDVNMNDAEARFALNSAPCGACGERSPRVWINAPRVQTTVAAVELGGRLFRRDDLEEKLADRSRPADFWDSPDFDREWHEALKKNTEKEIAGTLPPLNSEAEIQAVIKATGE